MYQLRRVGPAKYAPRQSTSTSATAPITNAFGAGANYNFTCIDGVGHVDYASTHLQKVTNTTILAANRSSRWIEGQIINVTNSFESESFGFQLTGGYGVICPAKVALAVVFGEVASVPAAGSTTTFVGAPAIVAYSPPVAISDERCMRAITWAEDVIVRHASPTSNIALYGHGVMLIDGGTGVDAVYTDRNARFTARTFFDSPKNVDPTR